jgi:hypothetical protein
MDVHDRITQLEAELASLKNHVMGESRGGRATMTEGEDGGPTSRTAQRSAFTLPHVCP